MRLPSKLELIMWGAAAICALVLILVIKRWHDLVTIELPKAEARIESLESVARVVVQQGEKSRETDNAVLTELAKINDPSRQLQPVRLCKPASGVRAVSPVASESVAADSGGESGLPPSDLGRDVSPGLTVYGKRCEAIALELRETRKFVEVQRELQRMAAEGRVERGGAD